MICYRMKTFVVGFYYLVILMSLYVKISHERAGVLKIEHIDKTQDGTEII